MCPGIGRSCSGLGLPQGLVVWEEWSCWGIFSLKSKGHLDLINRGTFASGHSGISEPKGGDFVATKSSWDGAGA